MSAASAWLGRMRKLNVYRAKGGAAPHKPLLLLVLLDMAEQGELPAGLVPLSPELAFRFFTLWSIAAPPQLTRLILARQFLDRKRFSLLVTALIPHFPNQCLKERVLKILAEYRVRAVSPEQVAAFAEEVQREAH